MAIDIIARGLATSLIGSDGKINSEKMPTLGEVPAGTTFYPVGQLYDSSQVAGKTAEEILLMMLYGIVTPTITEPSLSIALSDDMAHPIIGRQSALKGALTFNRGSIDPAYGTSGYRAGAPTKYSIGDTSVESSSTSYDFEILFTPTEEETAFYCTVEYGAGEQPVNSIGQPFGAPLAAGSISDLLLIHAAYPLYNGAGSEQEFIWFEEEDGSGYLSAFGSEVGGTRQSFMVSSSTKVIGVKAFNTLTQQWEWIGSQTAPISLTYFDTEVISGESLGETHNFIQYTYNSTPVGARELKVFVE